MPGLEVAGFIRHQVRKAPGSQSKGDRMTGNSDSEEQPLHEGPVRCETMEDVRAGIDMLDRKIVPLLCRRGAFVAEAARLKPSRDDVVDLRRIDAIADKVRDMAASERFDPDTIEKIYRAMIDAYIDFEHRMFDVKD